MAVVRGDSENIYKVFFSALHSGATLKDLVNIAESYIDNPILTVTVSGKVLVVSDNGDFGDADEQVHAEELRFPVEADSEEHTGKPFLFSLPDQAHDWLAAKVYMNGVCTAGVYAYSVRHPFTADDYEVMDILSKAVLLELMKGTYYRSNRYSLSTYFLSDLLDGNIRDSALINLRLRNLSWRPKKYMYILAIPISGTQNGSDIQIQILTADIQVQILTDQMRQHLPQSIGVFYMDALVFLTTNDEPLDEEATRPLIDMLVSSGLFAGMSQPFSSLSRVRDAYENALNVAVLARRLGDENCLVRFEDYMFLHVLNICSKSINVEGLCHPAVMRILEHDRAHGTSFFQTLQCFLGNALNSTLTSEALHVHRNTLLYRLDKIKQLTGIDLDDGETVFRLQFSIKIITFLRALDENSVR